MHEESISAFYIKAKAFSFYTRYPPKIGTLYRINKGRMQPFVHKLCTDNSFLNCFRNNVVISTVGYNHLLRKVNVGLSLLMNDWAFWGCHLLLPMNLCMCGMFKMGVFSAFHKLPSLLLLLSQLVWNILHQIQNKHILFFSCFALYSTLSLWFWKVLSEKKFISIKYIVYCFQLSMCQQGLASYRPLFCIYLLQCPNILQSGL